MKIGISIINYKTLELTRGCLESIFSKQWAHQLEVWVLDNASGDGSAARLKELFPNIHLIESEKNLGFANGHNLVLPSIKADYVLVLNSDTEVLPGSLDRMVDFMEQNSCDIASCKLIGFDDKLQPNSGDFPFGAALFNWLFNLEIFGFVAPNFHRNEVEYYKKSHEVDWVSGGCMMISSKVFRQTGYFEGDYFMYFEDVEFCFRAKKAGFKVMLNTDVSCKHLSGGSLDNPQFGQWSGELRNLLKFYKKNFGVGSATILRLLVYVATSLRVMAFLLTGRPKKAGVYAKVIKSI